MYQTSTQRFNSIVIIIVSIIAIPSMLYAPFSLVLVSLVQVLNNVNFESSYYMRVTFYTLAIIFIGLSLITFNQIDKKKWPRVTGEIIDVRVTVDPLAALRLWTLKYTFKFNYNEKNYFKKVFSKIIFNNEFDAQEFIDKIDWKDKKYLPVYVFKYYPELSSTETKMNIWYVFLLYVFILVNSMLVIIGLLANITITFNNPANIRVDLFAELKNTYSIYASKVDLVQMFLPILILFILVIFVIKNLRLLIKNKVFLFYAKMDPNTLNEEPFYGLPVELIETKVCLYCRSKNELGAKFCSDCAKMF